MPTTATKPTAQRTASSAPPVGDSRVVERASDAALYPIWLSTDAKALLDRVIAEQPDRSLVISRCFDGKPAEFGYRGKAAAALRTIWKEWYSDRIDWCSAVLPDDRPTYDKRRNALLSYAERHSADALIVRMIGGEA